MVTLQSVQRHTGLTLRFQFFDMALRIEHQSARMSKKLKGELDQYGAERFGRRIFVTITKV